MNRGCRLFAALLSVSLSSPRRPDSDSTVAVLDKGEAGLRPSRSNAEGQSFSQFDQELAWGAVEHLAEPVLAVRMFRMQGYVAAFSLLTIAVLMAYVWGSSFLACLTSLTLPIDVFIMEPAIVWKVKSTFLEFYDGVEKAKSSPLIRSRSLDHCRGPTRQVATDPEKRCVEPSPSSTKNDPVAPSGDDLHGSDSSQHFKSTSQADTVASSGDDLHGSDSSQHFKATSQADKESMPRRKRVHHWPPRRFRAHRELASTPPVVQTTQRNHRSQGKQQHLPFQQQVLEQQSEQFNKECSHDQRNASKIASDLAESKTMRDCRCESDLQTSNSPQRVGGLAMPRQKQTKMEGALRNERGGAQQGPQIGYDNRNTVMIRNIACRYSHEEVSGILEDLGLKGKYNYLYVPLNPDRDANLGYFFLNLIDEHHVGKCFLLFSGIILGKCFSKKRCEVSRAHLPRNSPLFW